MANEMKMEKNECAPQMNQPNVNESVRRRRRQRRWRHYYYYCYYYSLSSTSLKPNTLCSQQAQPTWMWCILKNVSVQHTKAPRSSHCVPHSAHRGIHDIQIGTLYHGHMWNAGTYERMNDICDGLCIIRTRHNINNNSNNNKTREEKEEAEAKKENF